MELFDNILKNLSWKLDTHEDGISTLIDENGDIITSETEIIDILSRTFISWDKDEIIFSFADGYIQTRENTEYAKYNKNQLITGLDVLGAINTHYDKEITEQQVRNIFEYHPIHLRSVILDMRRENLVSISLRRVLSYFGNFYFAGLLNFLPGKYGVKINFIER